MVFYVETVKSLEIKVVSSWVITLPHTGLLHYRGATVGLVLVSAVSWFSADAP